MNVDKNKLLELYPEYTSVLGPYKRKDNRKHFILNKSYLSKGSKNKLKTISFPKAVMEINLGKRLLQNETVDHIDRNKENDNSDNLQILDRKQHCKLDAIHVNVEYISCPICGNNFKPTRNQHNNNNIKAGPFCSKKCSGKYGSSVKNGGRKITRNKITKEHFLLKK